MLLNETILVKPILEEISREKLPEGVLCQVSYPICNIGQRNANKRVYEEDVYDRVMAEKDLQEKLENRSLFGHAEHPEQTQSNLEKTSHVIIEMWKDDGQVWQKFDVLDTPTGRIVDCLLRAGCLVGCSTRAEGDLEEAEDDEGTYQRVIPESYSYVTTDFTADPSTYGVIPHNVKRNVVSEVKKLLENKETDKGEKEFGTCLLKSMECDHTGKCKNCGCCEVLKEKKLTAKQEDELPKSAIHTCNICGAKFDDPADLNTSDLCKKCAKGVGEKKTVESLIKEGAIKAGDPVLLQYAQDDIKEAKIEKIEEGAVSLLVGVGDPTAVNVDGDAAISISPEGLITIIPTAIFDPKEAVVEPEVTEPVEEPPNTEAPPAVEPGTADAIIIGDETPVEEVPEAKGISATASPHIEDGYWEDAEGNKARVMDSSGKDLAVKLGSGEKVVMPEKEFLDKYIRHVAEKVMKVGAAVKIEEGEHKGKEGKVAKIEETGITIALDDGTTVSIEDPTAVNITVTAPAPAEEIELVGPPEEEVDRMEKAGPLPIDGDIPSEERFESKEITEDGVRRWTVRFIDGEGHADSFCVTAPSKQDAEEKAMKYNPEIDIKSTVEVEESKLPIESGISEELAAGNLLQDKEGKDWVVKEAGDGGLTVNQPGEPGTEKFIAWGDVDSHGFTKVSETIEEDISRKEFLLRKIKKLDRAKIAYDQDHQRKLDQVEKELKGLEAEGSGVKKESKVNETAKSEVIELLKQGKVVYGVVEGTDVDGAVFTVGKISDLKEYEESGYWDMLDTYPTEEKAAAQAEKLASLAINAVYIGVTESKVEEATSVQRDGEWFVESPSGATLGGPYGSKIEADKRKKDVEFYAASKESKIDEGVLPSDEEIAVVVADVLSSGKGPVEQTAKLLSAMTTEFFLTMDQVQKIIPKVKQAVEIWKSTKESKVDETKMDEAEWNDLDSSKLSEVSLNEPAGFDSCVDKGGRVRTVSGEEEHGLESGEYVKYCFIDGKSLRGDVHKKESESISTTAKEIKNLRVEEASTRAERDKAIELLEEIADEKIQLEKKVRKEKAFEIKILVNKIGKTLEAREQEVDAVRAKLEEKAKLAADMNKQFEEQKELAAKVQEQLNDMVSAASDRVTNLKESITVTEDRHHKDLLEVEKKHRKTLDRLAKVHEIKIKETKEETEERIKNEVTKEFVKSFIEFKLSETALKVDDNSQALLEKCKSLGEVEEVLEEIIDAGRRSALHSESIMAVQVPKSEIVDPEQTIAERRVKNALDGMNR